MNRSLLPTAMLFIVAGAGCAEAADAKPAGEVEDHDCVEQYDAGFTEGRASAEAELEPRIAALELALADIQSSMATTDDVEAVRSELTEGLDGLATEDWVTGLDHASNADLVAVSASVDSVSASVDTLSDAVSNVLADYLTAASLEGYATESWVITQGYSTDTVDPELTDLAGYLSVNTSTDLIIIDGANLQVRSGVGSTSGAVNGLGNLIVGYNELSSDTRTGSHNLVVGPYHSYSSYGGILGGYNNATTGGYATVSTGRENLASGAYAGVHGGIYNEASGSYSVVSAGYDNLSTHNYASVSGGGLNTAAEYGASIVGGQSNTVSSQYSTVVGGGFNDTTANFSAILGGVYNEAGGYGSVILGGTYESTSSSYQVVN